MINKEQYKKWSLLDPKPVFYKDERTQVKLCYWNGNNLTRNIALLIVSNMIWDNTHNRGETTLADQEMKKLVEQNIIDNGNYYNSALSYYDTFVSVLFSHIKEYFGDLTHYSAWEWFLKTFENDYE